MKLLAIETATPDGSVAILEDTRVTERAVDLRGEGVVAAIGTALAEAGWTARGLDAVVVSAGPGSFTGIRLGVSAAQGICFAADIPAVPVGTLEGLARAAAASDWGLPGTLCLASLDARRNEVYAALFRVESGWKAPESMWGPEPVRPQMLARKFAELLPAGGSVHAGVLAGDGAALLAPLFPPGSGWASPRALGRASAAAIARAGAERFRAGDVVGPETLEPVYLRKSDAEVARQKPSSRT